MEKEPHEKALERLRKFVEENKELIEEVKRKTRSPRAKKIKHPKSDQERKEYQRKYAKKHRKKMRAYRKKYYEANREKITEYHKKYYKEHREEIREKARKKKNDSLATRQNVG